MTKTITISAHEENLIWRALNREMEDIQRQARELRQKRRELIHQLRNVKEYTLQKILRTGGFGQFNPDYLLQLMVKAEKWQIECELYQINQRRKWLQENYQNLREFAKKLGYTDYEPSFLGWY